MEYAARETSEDREDGLPGVDFMRTSMLFAPVRSSKGLREFQGWKESLSPRSWLERSSNRAGCTPSLAALARRTLSDESLILTRLEGVGEVGAVRLRRRGSRIGVGEVSMVVALGAGLEGLDAVLV